MTEDGDLQRHESAILAGDYQTIDAYFQKQVLPRGWVYKGIEEGKVVLLRWVEADPSIGKSVD